MPDPTPATPPATNMSADPLPGTPPPGEGGAAMEGLRVLDLGTFIAGPHTASIFAEFGAEVLKIEHPVAGDPLRRFGSATDQPNRTLAFLSEARNRRSVTLDLRQPRGVELFLELVARSDVLIENFRPGRMEEWGLGWDVLRKANPGLVFLRVSGYGQTGPYREQSAFSHIAHAYAGLSHLAGFPGESPVVPGSVPLGDYISSLYGAIGVLLALRHREETGEGQVIDVAIFESVFRTLDEMAGVYGLFGTIRERQGVGSFVAVPHGHFRTRDDHWIAIACTTDRMFGRLAQAMGRPELAEPDMYGDQKNRLAAREAVDAMVEAWVASLTRSEVMEVCLEAQVPCGGVNSIADIFEDEHFRARDMLVPVEVEGVGEVVVPGVLPRLSATPGRITGLGPALGDATLDVLRDVLGLGEEELEALRADQVI